MDKLKMHTENKVDINIEKIGSLFPNTLTEKIKGYDENNKPIIEKAIDFDILKQELSKVIVEGREERYQMNWPGKKEAILTANAPINKTLRPYIDDKESVDFYNTENLYIEGDNLEVLKLLQETYLNKVKMIYIDPPYNTGNDSFVYNDKFSMSNEEFNEVSGQYDEDGNINYDIRKNSESNGKFHTDWLNMMYPTLKLARDLLREDGVICISIDDYEITNIRKMCDEIFGEKNFLINNIWISGRTSASYFTNSHEYVLVYAKDKNNLPFFSYKGPEAYVSDRTIKKASIKNPVSDIHFPEGIEFEGDDKIFPLSFGESESVEVVQGVLECKNGKLNNPVTIRAAWTMKDMINSWLKGKEVFDQKGQKIRRFYFKSNGVLQYEKIKGTIHPNSIISNISTKNGTNEIKSLFEKEIFSYPKPTELIKSFINLITSKEDIILDFFSGSATTAHAVMQLNAEDGGKRKFIMVQVPEKTDEKSEARKAGYKNICEIGKERIRRAGKKIKEENPNTADKLDTGFRVLKLDSSNMKDVYYNPSDYNQDMIEALESNIKDDRSNEDLLFQVMLDLGELLSSDIKEINIQGKKVLNVGDGNIIACFDEDITNEILTEIAKMQPFYAIFRDSSLSNDSVVTNFEQIFKTYSPNTITKVL